jgi:Sulfotransferase domain
VPTRPLALWTTPRSVSTAFERMVIERGDFEVRHEPFSMHYYFGLSRRSDRYAEVRADATPARIRAEIDEANRHRRVFLKDMASHVRGLLTPDFLAAFEHTVLIRDPAWALPSLEAHWPDFTEEEAGYGALDELVDAATARGSTPVVIDSDDLRANPAGTVAAYCDAVGIPFVAAALDWAPGMPGSWEVWEDWHREAAASEGFQPPPSGPPPPMSPKVARVHERCWPVYDRLRARRLRPG